MTILDTFNAPTTFATIPIGGKFIEAFTTCNEIVIRIEPTIHRCKPMNARRAGGKLIRMVGWEPVFADRKYIICTDCKHLERREHNTVSYYCFHPHWSTKRGGSIGAGSLWVSSDAPPIGASRYCPVNGAPKQCLVT